MSLLLSHLTSSRWKDAWRVWRGCRQLWDTFFTPAISQPNLVTTFLSGVMVTPNSRSEAAGVILVLARGKVRGVAGLLGGGVEVNSGDLLAVELELLGGSGAGDLHGLDLREVGLNLELLARGVPGGHGHLILAGDVPGDGEETTEGTSPARMR